MSFRVHHTEGNNHNARVQYDGWRDKGKERDKEGERRNKNDYDKEDRRRNKTEEREKRRGRREEEHGCIGKGTFGQVIEENNGQVRKIFDRLKYMMQEIMVLRYMMSSDYIVKMKGFNLKVPSINLERWSCSLKDLLLDKTVQLTELNKMKIFKHVLMGLSHMHQLGILHSDLKLSNILIDKETYNACICDLGLSSLINYAKIGQTADAYRPRKPRYSHGHDMFGLTVSMIDIFAEIKIKKVFTAKELRSIIRGKMNIQGYKKIDPIVQDALLRMCPDDPKDAATADEILRDVFEIRTDYNRPVPALNFNENNMSENKRKYIFDTVMKISEKYKVNRNKRCYQSLINFFNSPSIQELDDKHWELYIAGALFIYKSLFGTPAYKKKDTGEIKVPEFDENVALEVLRDKYTIDDFRNALEVLIFNDDFTIMTLTDLH